VSDWQEQRRRQDTARRAEVMALPALQVCHRAAIAAVHDGDVRVCASVGPAGEVIALRSAVQDLRAVTSKTVQPGWATFPDPRALRTVTARMTVHAPEAVSVISISGLNLAHVTAQPLPGGRILVVGARSRWRPEGPDRNAIVYDADGHVPPRNCWAMALSTSLRPPPAMYGWDISTKASTGTTAGAIPGTPRRWAPAGWPGFPQTFSPIGATPPLTARSGRSATATRSTSTTRPPGLGTTPASRSSRSTTASSWDGRTTSTAPKRLAVTGSQVALYGGYGPNHDRLAVGQLQAGRLRLTGEYRLVRPGGASLPARTQVLGRGPCLHFLTDDNWYQLTMNDIPARPHS
jgi:hypothetical protein